MKKYIKQYPLLPAFVISSDIVGLFNVCFETKAKLSLAAQITKYRRFTKGAKQPSIAKNIEK